MKVSLYIFRCSFRKVHLTTRSSNHSDYFHVSKGECVPVTKVTINVVRASDFKLCMCYLSCRRVFYHVCVLRMGWSISTNAKRSFTCLIRPRVLCIVVVFFPFVFRGRTNNMIYFVYCFLGLLFNSNRDRCFISRRTVVRSFFNIMCWGNEGGRFPYKEDGRRFRSKDPFAWEF